MLGQLGILGGPVSPDWWLSMLRVISFPVSTIYSLGNVLGRIFMFPAHPLVGRLLDLWPLYVPLALAGAVVLLWLIKREFALRPAWGRLIMGVVVANLAFYGLVGLWRNTAGLEERFFKPVGFLLLPALVDAILTARLRWAAWLLGASLAFSSAYGVSSFVNRAHYLRGVANPGWRGTTQHNLSREGLAVLHAVDATLPGNSLVVVPSPEMALEFRRVRCLPTHALRILDTALAANHYRGRVDNLVVLVDEEMLARGQAQALLGSFADYPADAWTPHPYGTWIFFHQGSFAGWPAPAHLGP